MKTWRDRCTRSWDSGSSNMKRPDQTTVLNEWKATGKKSPRSALQGASHLDVTETSIISSRALNKVLMRSPAVKSTSKPGKTKQGKKASYRHIPHSEKPPHLVAKRNERERKRVQAVNSAFLRLRKYVPHEPRNKRLSKFKTLKFAIQYIQQMQDMIQAHDWREAYQRQNVSLLDGNDQMCIQQRQIKTGPPCQNTLPHNHGSVIYAKTMDFHRQPGFQPENFGYKYQRLQNPPEHLELSPPDRHQLSPPTYTQYQYTLGNNRNHMSTQQFTYFEDTTAKRRDSSAVVFHIPDVSSQNRGDSIDQRPHTFCYISDCPYPNKTPYTSSRADSWEDCSSDTSSSCSHDVVQNSSIPLQRQVVSFLNTGNDIDTGTSMRETCLYTEPEEFQHGFDHNMNGSY